MMPRLSAREMISSSRWVSDFSTGNRRTSLKYSASPKSCASTGVLGPVATAAAMVARLLDSSKPKLPTKI